MVSPTWNSFSFRSFVRVCVRASGQARQGEAVCVCATMLLSILGGWRSVCGLGRGVRRVPVPSLGRALNFLVFQFV